MTQPLDRTCRIPHVGELAIDEGEFWVENPFEMTEKGDNLSAYERNRLYLNAGNFQFVNASFASACDIDSDSRTAIGMDYDNDGDEDLLVGNVGGGSLRLFENNFPKRNSIKIRLKGVQSNSLGIGSRVTFQVGDKQIVRDMFLANGFMGNGPAEILAGLGDAKVIDSIEVRWPTGKTQKIESVKANQTVVITEGEATPAFIEFSKK